MNIKIDKEAMDSFLEAVTRAFAIIGLIAIIVLSANLASGATLYLDNGQCQDFTYMTAEFNNQTNQTDYTNKTETFCAIQQNITNYCSIKNWTLEAGEVFEKHDGACDIGITCEVDPDMFEWDIPIDVTADMDWIRVSVGTDTQSYPRDSKGFTYSTTNTVQCPAVEMNRSVGDPQSLMECLSILTEEQRENDQCPNTLTECQSERDNFKVEWETRGVEVDSLNIDNGKCQATITASEKKASSSNSTNWLLLILSMISWAILIVIGILKLMKRSSKIKG